jgi:hypothetical protein
VGDHVIYESRLELGRLLFADFAPEVRHIVAQPFLLKADIDGKVRKHIPDYLLLTDAGPLVVDVKPRHRLEKPEVAFTFSWTREAVTSRGWRYEVWSEPHPAVLENIRFLAGYRRDWLFDPDLVGALRATDLDGMLLGDAFRLLPDCPRPLVKSRPPRLSCAKPCWASWASQGWPAGRGSCGRNCGRPTGRCGPSR